MPYKIRRHVPGYVEIDPDNPMEITVDHADEILTQQFLRLWTSLPNFLYWELIDYTEEKDNAGNVSGKVFLLRAIIGSKGWVTAYITTHSDIEEQQLRAIFPDHSWETNLLVAEAPKFQPASDGPRPQWIEGQPPTDPKFKVCDPVATIFDLPPLGNEINDCRLVIAHRKYHYWIVY